MAKKVAKDRQQTLATGKQAGFTLLEIMVVAALIGLISAAVVVNFSTAPGPNQARQFLSELRASMQHYNTQAMARQRWLGIRFSNSHYEPMLFTNAGWQTLSDTSPRSLPDTLDILLDVEGESISLSQTHTEPQLLFAPDGSHSAFRLEIRGDDDTRSFSDPFAPVIYGR